MFTAGQLNDETSYGVVFEKNEIYSARETEQLSTENKKIPEILDQKYYRGLDGLRGISVILVLIDHSLTGTHFQRVAHLGNMGVEIFFVISGFLITTLLLKDLKK